MKKYASLLALIWIAAGGIATRAADLTYTQDGTAPKSAVNAVLCSTKNIDIDLNANRIDYASVQVIDSSAVVPTVTFTDGVASTGNITVASLTGLTTAYATDNITVTQSAGALSNQTVKVTTALGSLSLTEGKQWSQLSVASNTAISLCGALNSAFGNIFVSTVQPGGTVIYSTAVVAGSAANAFAMSVSTVALTVATPNFIGGNDNAVLTIAGKTITANSDYFPITTAATAATRLAAAINTLMGGTIKAQAAGSVVYATSTFTGAYTNYSMSVSTTALTLSGAAMLNGKNSDITTNFLPIQNNGYYNYSNIVGGTNLALSTINKTPTSMGTGHPLLFGVTAGTAPGGLTNKTTYYASNLTATGFQVSDTSTGAAAGLFISITTTTQTGGGTFTLTAIVLSGTPSFKLQKSNDGINFLDVYVSTQPTLAPMGAAVSIPSPYTAGNAMWDLGQVFYRYLRLAFSNALNAGCVNINEVVNAKKQ